ncbi:alpha-galactosidase [bacterium]|nr:alpha-galactosidase [bacterium]
MQQLLSFQKGALSLKTPWGSAGTGILRINGVEVKSDWQGDGPWTCRFADWHLTVSSGPRDSYDLALENRGDQEIFLGNVSFGCWSPNVFDPPLDAASFRELTVGESFLSMRAGAKKVGRPTPFLDGVSPSAMVTIYQQEKGPALLLGILPPVRDAFTCFETVHSEPHLEAFCGLECGHVFDCRVAPGREVRTAAVVALSGGSGAELLSEFGALWGELIDRKPSRAPQVGWNSWDYYSGAVTRAAMDENLAEGRRLFGEKFQVLAIDEGWERQWGDWQANGKFPEGLDDFCRHVKEQGAIPGVWTAPMLVNTYNPLYLEHPDWFGRRADGQIREDTYGYGPMVYLDPTEPEVLDHLRCVFTRLRRAGVEYFKVDYCQCILKVERFADRAVPRVDLLRRVFRTIREAIGEEAYLLSCGSPFESVFGIADAVRTTSDIHIYWGHILRNAGALASLFWIQGNICNGDPDFLVVRGPDTAESPYQRVTEVKPLGLDGGWMAGRYLNESEARVYALLVHLSGGDVVMGDRLKSLLPHAIEMLRRVLEPRPAAIPVDLFETEQDLPRIWISRGEKDTVVGLFNWDDKSFHLNFDPACYGLKGTPKDFWTDRSIGNIPREMTGRSSIGLVYSASLDDFPD